MRESIGLSPTPVGEDCAQLGDLDYHSRARKECNAFIGQLIRQFGAPPTGVSLRIARNPHDFGTYLDVEVRFDSDDEQAVEWAYRVEAELPEFWDEVARQELGAE